MTDDDVLDELLDVGLDDWVPLDEVIWAVAQGDISVENRARMLRMFDRIYSEDLMVPGDLGETGFEDWAGSPADGLTDRARSLSDSIGTQWVRASGSG